MIQRGHYPDVVTYNLLMDGYCLRGEVDEALAVLTNMTRKGILPDTRSYNILINGCCKMLIVDIALDLFRQLSLAGLTPTIETCNTILHGFFQVGRHVDARKFYEKMLYKVQWLISSYSHLQYPN